jgi:hypothetical protein
VKHLSADDSGRTSVKVGHRQALTLKTPQAWPEGFCLCGDDCLIYRACNSWISALVSNSGNPMTPE